MEKLDPKVDGSSMDIVEDNIEKLKEIFPDVFNEDQVDIVKLKERLGEFASDDDDERYNFSWHGKSQAKRIAQKPSTGTLRPAKKESKDWDSTDNLYIEGDNLEVLKLLQKSYHNKVKMIYIDPPYNTGKDFVYKDNYKDTLKNYLELTAQVDEEGNKLSTNSDNGGRYHTNWLNMMYPRLRLARNLLKKDGVIFISIDDNELDNLKKISNEIFGEDNFIAMMVHKNNSMKNQSKYMGVTTEYILIYAKNIEILKELDKKWRQKKKGAREVNMLFKKLNAKGLTLKEIDSEIKDLYSRPKYSHLSRWNKVDEKGVFKDQDLSREGGPKDYTIINPNTNKPCVIPNRGWGKSYEDLLQLQEDELIWYGNEDTPPGMKTYLTEDSTSVPDNYMFVDTSTDKKLIDNLYGGRVFEYPKSLELIEYIIFLCTNPNRNDIILDFFAGSSTSAHAIIELNAQDSGDRRFIMVQLPEPIDKKSYAYKSGYKTISDIGKERVRRAGEKIKEENKDEEGIEDLDIGFKVFKLDSSNIKTWDATLDDDLEQTLFDMQENIKEDRTEEDLVYEVLLKYGLDLTLPIEELSIKNKKVYVIGFGALVICLDQNIGLDLVEVIGKMKEKYQTEIMRVIFKDNSFKDDVVKTNAIQILKKYGIDDVKSL